MSRIPQDQKFFLQQFCHLNMLAGLVFENRAPVGALAFQGGTSLRLAWGSPRFSEDLDFLICDNQIKTLGKVVNRAAKRMHEALIRQGYTGETEIVSPKKYKDLSVLGYWVNYIDSRYGGEKIRVKCEFKPVTLQQMKEYATTLREASDPSVNVLLRPTVEVATLESVLADKVMAITGRAHFKYRDFFDLWWITTQSRVPELQSRAQAFIADMTNEFSIYGRRPEEFLDSLGKVLDDLKSNMNRHSKQAQDELSLWLGQNENGRVLREVFLQSGTFRQMVVATSDCLEQARTLLREAKDQIDEDLDDNLSLSP